MSAASACHEKKAVGEIEKSIGIDIGKRKCVTCVMEVRGVLVTRHRMAMSDICEPGKHCNMARVQGRRLGNEGTSLQRAAVAPTDRQVP